MKFYMIGLYTWISLVYYYIYCEERSYNGVMAMFWGVMAIIWIWDAITGYTTFERTHKYDLLSYVLLAMPFIYILLSAWCRHADYSGNDFSGHALFGSGVYHRIVIAVCAKGQYVFGIVPLPLVADRIIQNLFLSDSGRFLIGKCYDPMVNTTTEQGMTGDVISGNESPRANETKGYIKGIANRT